MLLRLAVLAALLALPVTPLAQPSSSHALYLQGVEAMLAKRFAAAISAYDAMLKAEDVPAWAKLAAEADLAYAFLASKKKTEGLAHLERAIELGFNDDEMIRTDPVFAPYRKDAELLALYERIRVSEADRVELSWLKHEAETIAKETEELLDESESRVDLFFSEVVQAQLPSRPFQSLWVGVSRQIVGMLQDLSRRAILDADHRRILQTGTRIYATVDEISIAHTEAAARRKERQERLRARAFSLGPSVSTTLKPPPPLNP